jgi:hypothetical protein
VIAAETIFPFWTTTWADTPPWRLEPEPVKVPSLYWLVVAVVVAVAAAAGWALAVASAPVAAAVVEVATWLDCAATWAAADCVLT